MRLSEMHVEQSAVLDTKNISIGIVQAIAGYKCLEVKFKGTSNHAGATPMHLRNDPMLGSARVIAYIAEIIKNKAFPSTVGTVGKIECKPNVSNIIPESVTFAIDIRDINSEGIQIVQDEVMKLIYNIAEELGLLKELTIKSESSPTVLSPIISKIIIEVANNLNIKYKKMNSGAIHDSSILADITDVGMIFVPSKGGRSHSAEEMTDYKDIQRGCELLLSTILKLDEM